MLKSVCLNANLIVVIVLSMRSKSGNQKSRFKRLISDSEQFSKLISTCSHLFQLILQHLYSLHIRALCIGYRENLDFLLFVTS